MAAEQGFTISTSGSTLSGLVGSAAGIGLAAYVVSVALHGNIQQLGQALLKEEKYLEFAIAIVIVWALAKWGPTSPITDLLIVGVVIGVALRLASNTSLPTALTAFANGQASMLQTVQALFGGSTYAG